MPLYVVIHDGDKFAVRHYPQTRTLERARARQAYKGVTPWWLRSAKEAVCLVAFLFVASFLIGSFSAFGHTFVNSLTRKSPFTAAPSIRSSPRLRGVVSLDALDGQVDDAILSALAHPHWDLASFFGGGFVALLLGLLGIVAAAPSLLSQMSGGSSGSEKQEHADQHVRVSEKPLHLHQPTHEVMQSAANGKPAAAVTRDSHAQPSPDDGEHYQVPANTKDANEEEVNEQLLDADQTSSVLPSKDRKRDQAKVALKSWVSSVGVAVLGAKVMEGKREWWEPARDTVTQAADSAASSVTEAAQAVTQAADSAASGAVAAANDAVYAIEAAAADSVTESGAADATLESFPLPVPPGMERANVKLSVAIPAQKAVASSTGSVGVHSFMHKSNEVILRALAQDGWQVKSLEDEEGPGVFEMLLPPVRYPLPLGVVTIPPPRFRTVMRDTFTKAGEGLCKVRHCWYEERGIADMVLENGEGLCKVELRFPFSQTFSISAAGVGRCYIGWEGESVSIRSEVEAGLRIPAVPGVRSIMEVFVRSYLTQAVMECSEMFAQQADQVQIPSGLEVLDLAEHAEAVERVETYSRSYASQF